MNMQDFKQRAADVLDMYRHEEASLEDCLEHLRVLAEKLLKTKCNDFASNMVDFVLREVNFPADAQKEDVGFAIRKAPLPDFNA